MVVTQARLGWDGDLVSLKPSLSGTAMFTTKLATDQLSGWSVDAVTMTPFTVPLCVSALAFYSEPSSPSDPSPLVPPYLALLNKEGRPGSCPAVINALPEPGDSVYYRNSLEPGVPGMPIQASGLMVRFHVTRFWVPYLITGRSVKLGRETREGGRPAAGGRKGRVDVGASTCCIAHAPRQPEATQTHIKPHIQSYPRPRAQPSSPSSRPPGWPSSSSSCRATTSRGAWGPSPPSSWPWPPSSLC
jgi:hypothetical protein